MVRLINPILILQLIMLYLICMQLILKDKIPHEDQQSYKMDD